MQSLEGKTIRREDLRCAKAVMDSVPVVMHAVVARLRAYRPHDVSIPQFRALAFLRRQPGASLSELAQEFGLALPTMSRMIDGLVRRGFVRRDTSSEDRRRVVLNMTRSGLAAFNRSRARAETRVGEALSVLSAGEKKTVSDAMQVLRQVFDHGKRS